MSVTYPVEPAKPYGDRIETPRADLTQDEPFVPVYARRGRARGGQGKVRTWMILAPVAVLTLGGVGAFMVMNGGEEASAPLVEPAATLPVLPATPAPVEPAVAPSGTAAPAPVVTAASPARDAAPLRRVAPTPARRTAAPATVAAPRAEPSAPAVATGSRPYEPAATDPATTTLNTVPANPAPTPAAPVIIVEPVG